jgi:uncharacterized membrane protein
VVGLVLLWPSGKGHDGPSTALGGPTVPAKVTKVLTVRCPGPAGQRCRQIEISVGGARALLTLGPVAVSSDLAVGTDIRVARIELPRGTPVPKGFEPWQFRDVERRGSLLWIGVALAIAALAVIRLRGLLALVGAGLSVLLVTRFLVPALLEGQPALLVALVGSSAVMFITIVLTHGFGAQTLAAALGVGATLLLTCLIAMVAVDVAHLDGRSGELSAFLSLQDEAVSLQGVVLAGMVVGALGVLADTAVTQASAVMALRRTDPALSPRGLYRQAFVVGRDHLSATIHTLVLAYVGASLPLLLVMRSAGVDTGTALNSQDIAEPVLATLVGCIGLVAAVPLTTGLAAVLVSRVPVEALSDAHAGHGH